MMVTFTNNTCFLWTVLSLLTSTSSLSLSLSSSPTPTPKKRNKQKQQGMRVNRALRATHSRREVNHFISNGRISCNGKVTTNPDDRLSVNDIVRLDDQVIMWEEKDLPTHRYLKYHKPRGVICTTDRRVEGNIVDEVETSILRNNNININNNINNNNNINKSPHQRRVYPIGRLDGDSTGLILLTSDGDIVNPLLRTDDGNNNNNNNNISKRKEYHVVTEPMATDENIIELCEGIVITTLARRDGVAGVPISARTLPCLVERKEDASLSTLRFVITEGRNRQIRKMCSSLGLKVIDLHRVNFAGITLDGCERLGDCSELTKEEMVLIGKGPTRDELRTPEERQMRKLKKLNKKRKRI